jgi:hypothetical protein
MKRTHPRTAAELNGSTHRRLDAYALAAGAAGVGMLALAQPSGAKIVYTPAHRIIGPGSSYKLDLSHDGITDFTLRDLHHTTGTVVSGGLSAVPAAGNGVEGTLTRSRPWAYALKRGAVVGPRRPFKAKRMVSIRIEDSTHYSYGSWLNVSNRYLGVRFKIAGKVHYGWARLSVAADQHAHVTATLTGYAYETIPNKAITAGQTKGPEDTIEKPDAVLRAPTSKPATLALLALGSPALSIWRRKETLSTAQ